ncbi:YhfH family protein [Planococcus sp. CPCC 101016]|nr:YhfH family protein [Planococcus sp. CPCC 101016]
MKNMQTHAARSKKECRECGCEIKEQRESIIYECERCIGNKEE